METFVRTLPATVLVVLDYKTEQLEQVISTRI